ncbi:MATE family efflux transporter [Nemorincola caseinilytica]|uniref:Multidrug-efflux transporter n=1 Tax=Nemorincola caseinilytica TaxID=2054315 RepID=A0ABP8NEW5_9BACT
MNNLGVKATNRQILKLAAPISLALLIPQLNFFTNTVFLGMLGQRELGVNGITGVFYLILSMISYGLASGVQIQMARRAGEGDEKGLGQLFANGAMLSVMFSLGLMLLTLWLVPLLFGFSLHDNQNFELSVHFIYIRVWGLPFLALTQLLYSFFISISMSRMLIYGSVAATAMNILMDYLLIFGYGGFPEMGFSGAAVASVIAEIAGCLVMVGVLLYNRLHIKYPLLRYLRFDPELSQRSLRVAAPLIVQFLFSIGGWLVFFFFIEHLGGQALAASQVLRNIFGIISVGTWALATTCNTMVSNIIGQGRQDEVIRLIWKIARLSFLYTFVICAVLLLFSHTFLSVYTGDESLIQFALPSLRVIAVATLIMSLSTVVFNGVVGTGNTIVNLTMEMTCVGIYLVYCHFIIRLWHSPLYLCWGSEFVYWTALLVGAVAYLYSGRWKNKEI